MVDDVIHLLSERNCHPRRSGAGWSARCPGHDDKQPSLSISSNGDGRVLLHCHAGCTPERVCDALGITVRDLFPPEPTTNGNGHREEVCRYRYEDEDGHHLYDVIRWAPKGFSQAPADGRRGAGAMEGVRRVLYHLPRLAPAITTGQTIYICEGEKDVHSIEAAGGVATTNPGGAGKWRSEYNATLKDAHVLIVADRDATGEAHAQAVAAQLSGHAKSIAIVHPLHGKDATDHLTKHTLGELRPKPRASRFTIETSREFSDRASDDIPCLVRGLWPEGSLGFISGPPKARKTWLALQLGICIAAGKPLFGKYAVPRPRRVLYVALEGHRAALRARYWALTRGAGLDPSTGEPTNLLWTYKPPGIDLADPEWAADLVATSIEQDAGIVIIDVLRAAAMIDENQAKEFAKLRQNLQPMLTHGTSAAILHHFGKLTEITKERAPAERMAGTGAMRGAADVGLYLTSKVGAEQSRISIEARDLATPDDFAFRIQGHGSGEHGGFTHHDTCRLIIDEELPEEGDVKAPARLIYAFIVAKRGRVRPKEIKDHFGISDGTLGERREALHDLGVEYVQAGRDSMYVIPTYDPLEEDSE